MDAVGAASPGRLAEVLLDFGRQPGNFLVRLGEPRELHSQLETLASWALGRLPPELEADNTKLREAAVLFVLRACFAPNSTHYQVLGLSDSTCTPAAVRARYRALIRLTHPDMGVEGLPADAAGIVNRANQVLSDADLRQQYDEQLKEQKQQIKLSSSPRHHQARPHVRRIERSTGLAEKFRSLNARFPGMIGIGLPVAAVSLLALGAVVLSLKDNQNDRRLIIARAPQATPDSRSADGSAGRRETAAPSKPATKSAAPPTPEPNSSASWLDTWRPKLDEAPATHSANPRTPSLDSTAPAQAAEARSQQAPAAEDSPPKAQHRPETALFDAFGSAAKPKHEAAPAPAPAPVLVATPTPARTPAAAPVATRIEPVARAAQTVEAASPRPSSSERPAAAAEPRVVETVQASVAKAVTTQAAARPASPSGQAPAPAPAPVPAPAPAPAPVQVARDPAWSIDKPGAKHYLVELVSTLERPNEARQKNAYMLKMNVKGSLLAPVLRLSDQFPEVQIEQMKWSDSEQAGVFKLKGIVVVSARNPETSATRRVNYDVAAEFWGTANGTVLADLELRESN